MTRQTTFTSQEPYVLDRHTVQFTAQVENKLPRRQLAGSQQDPQTLDYSEALRRRENYRVFLPEGRGSEVLRRRRNYRDSLPEGRG